MGKHNLPEWRKRDRASLPKTMHDTRFGAWRYCTFVETVVMRDMNRKRDDGRTMPLQVREPLLKTIDSLGILAGSASYIAVPAVMRLALPQANPGLYLGMSLAVTFPFNITIGIALYRWIAMQLAPVFAS